MFVIVGYRLKFTPSTPEYVDIADTRKEAEEKCRRFLSPFADGEINMVNEDYFSVATNDTDFIEARIYDC